MKRALSLLAFLLVPALAFAQAETTGKISGTVRNPDGTPAKDVRISVSSPSLSGGEREFTTDANGRFLAALLPNGDYTVVITAPNAQPAVRTVRVGIGQTVPLEVALLSGGTKEEVTVYGDLSKLETTALGENFNYDKEVNELPITNRDPERVAELAPNISFGPTPNTLSIAGAPSFDTVVLLDGAEVSDPYFGSAPALFLEEALDEVQVLTSGISARYGRFQGGVINATTKSGGNTFDGSARIDLTKEEWNEKTPFPGETQSDSLNQTYSATFSGPIIKDHLTFFLGGRKIKPTEATNQTALTGLNYITTTEQERFQAKLTAAINPNHIFDLNYAKFDQTTDDAAGLPAADLRSLAPREDPRETGSLEYQGVLSDSLFLNVFGTMKRVAINSGGDPANGSPFLDFYGAGFQIWHNHWWDFNDASDRDNDTASASLTKVLSTSDWGEHTFEVGAQYVNSMTAGENKQSSTGFNLLNYDAIISGESFSNLDPNNPLFNLISLNDPVPFGLTYRWEALPLGGGQELKNTAVYLQDSWQFDKIRIDAGLRWEQYKGEGPEPTLDLDFDAISPRIGFTYNMDSNWQLQATWGRYVSRFNDNVASSVSGVGGAPYIVSLYTGPTQCALGTHCLTYDDVEAILRDDANWGIITTITDPTQPTRFLADDISAPYADELQLTVKRALPRNTGVFTISYIDRAYRDLLDDFVGDFGFTTVTDPKGSGASFDFDTTIWDNSDQARRDYNALALTFDFRPSALWNMGGNYTYAETQANYEGEGRNTPSSGSIIGDYPRSVIEQGAFPYGYSDDDIRHRARVWGTRTFDFGRPGNLVMGGIATYQSGLPYNKTGGVAFGDDPVYLNEAGTSYTYFVGGRGNNRFNGWWRLDISGRYNFNIVKDFSAYVKVDVLNVTNNDELIAFNTGGSVADNGNGVLTFTPGALFGTPRSKLDYQLPRSYFFAFGLEF